MKIKELRGHGYSQALIGICRKCLHGRLHGKGAAVAKVKLTALKVDGFTCPADKPQAFLWDSDVPGLALRVTKNGAKAFIFQSRFMGKPLRMTR